MKKVLEAIGVGTVGLGLFGAGMVYGGALGIVAATDRKTAEKTIFGRALVKVINERKAKKLQTSYAKVIEDRKPKKPYISYANLAKIREAEKKDWATAHADEIIKELREVERKVNEKFKDRDTVSTDEIVKEVRKELGVDRTDKWPFFSMTEEEQR